MRSSSCFSSSSSVFSFTKTLRHPSISICLPVTRNWSFSTIPFTVVVVNWQSGWNMAIKWRATRSYTFCSWSDNPCGITPVGIMAWWSVTFDESKYFLLLGSFFPLSGSVSAAYCLRLFSIDAHFGKMSSLRYVVSTRGYVVYFFSYKPWMSLSVVSAEYPNLRLHSTCKVVKSKRRGAASCPFFLDISVTWNSFPVMRASAAWPSSSVSNFPEVAVNIVSRYIVASTQYGWGTKSRISRHRLTIIANVGVCTRPTDKGGAPTLCVPYFKVYKREAFIPSSQSPIARHSPAS